MTSGEADLGEQMLSKVAEMGIASQLDEVEQLEVDIRTNPIQLMLQGKVDSVSLSGTGMVMKESLRMEAIEVSMGTVAVNPASAVLGKIELTQPTEAQARVVLTEADINTALQSDYLHRKMQHLPIHLNPPGSLNQQDSHQDSHPQVLTIAIQTAQMKFLANDKIQISATLQIVDTGEVRHVAAIGTPLVGPNGDRLMLRDLEIAGEDHPPGLTQAILQEVMALSDARNFELDGIILHYQEIDVQAGRLILQTVTTVERMPGLSA